MAKKQKNKNIDIYLLLILSMFLMATMFPITKILLITVPPILLIFLRFLTASLILLAITIYKSDLHLQKGHHHLLYLEGLGLIGVCLYSISLVLGIKYSTATNSSILSNISPLFIVILSPLLIGESFTKRRLFGAFIGFVGVLLVVLNGESLSSLLSSQYFFGNTILIAGAFLMGLYSIFVKPLTRQYGALKVTSINMLAGVFFLLAITILNGEMAYLTHLTQKELLLIIYIGIVPTALVWLIWNHSFRIIGVINSTAFKFLIPIFAIILSIIFLKESLSFYIIIGLILILCGISLAQKKETH